MPGYKGHLIGGLCTYSILLYVLRSYCSSYLMGVEWLIFTLAGSLFPDIDVKSKGQKYFYRIIFIVFCLLLVQKKYQTFICVSIISLVPMLVRHRGLLHSFWFIVSMFFGVWFLITVYTPLYASRLLFPLIFFVAGAISHLWLDKGIRRLFV